MVATSIGTLVLAFVFVLSIVPTPADRLEHRGGDIEVFIHFARHGQSCANAINAWSNFGRLRKNWFRDPALTDCGVQQSMDAGLKLAHWMETDAAMEFGGADAFHGFDFVGASGLTRAIETAAFMFARMNPTAMVYAVPYISEHGFTLDNKPTQDLNEQEALITAMKQRVSPAPPADAGIMGRQSGIDWNFFSSVDMTYIRQPHVIDGIEQPPGTGRVESDINKFYQFLAENVLPDIAKDKRKGDTIRLAFASHSHFLKATFEDLCRLAGKPANNDVLVVKYTYSATEMTLKPATTENACISPVSTASVENDFRLALLPEKPCSADIRRCNQQQMMTGSWVVRLQGQTDTCTCTRFHELPQDTTPTAKNEGRCCCVVMVGDAASICQRIPDSQKNWRGHCPKVCIGTSENGTETISDGEDDSECVGGNRMESHHLEDGCDA